MDPTLPVVFIALKGAVVLPPAFPTSPSGAKGCPSYREQKATCKGPWERCSHPPPARWQSYLPQSIYTVFNALDVRVEMC